MCLDAGEGVILSVPILGQDATVALAETEAADYWGNPIRIDVAKSGSVPREFALLQNIPNPFNAATRITFNLPEPGDVSLVVYDVLGRKVTTLVDGYLESGTHHVIWDARDANGGAMASGVYFYRLVTGTRQANRKMVLLK